MDINTVFPRNLAAAKFYFKAQLGAQTLGHPNILKYIDGIEVPIVKNYT